MHLEILAQDARYAERSLRHTPAFTVAAVMNVVGFIGWVFVLPKIAPLKWSEVAS